MSGNTVKEVEMIMGKKDEGLYQNKRRTKTGLPEHRITK